MPRNRMSDDSKFLVITSIASPNEVLKTYARECPVHGFKFLLIGDAKSPPDFHLPGCDFWSLQSQENLDFEIRKTLPAGHYARKNLGYLHAAERGAKIIVETDDDNLPLDGFWHQRASTVMAAPVREAGWVNVYRHFTGIRIWPRGLPLENVQDPFNTRVADVESVNCPIQQGLADENPDVDAVYRLTLPLPVYFDANQKPLALGRGAWSPFNSQNTTWFREAFPLMYLPSHCSFRMTDIWRSYIAQRLAWECGWSILYHAPTVYQKRNEHNLIRDFEEEIPGYLQNAGIADMLAKLDLQEGIEHILDNLLKAYSLLCRSGIIGPQEMQLVEAWCRDCKNLGF